METAPRNCRFLSLVVVELVLKIRKDAAFCFNWKLLLIVELSYLQLTILASLLTVGVFFCLLFLFLLLTRLELFCLQWESASNKGLKGL